MGGENTYGREIVNTVARGFGPFARGFGPFPVRPQEVSALSRFGPFQVRPSYIFCFISSRIELDMTQK